MADEWGPWVEHDGRGCPPSLVGHLVGVQFLTPGGGSREHVGRVSQVDVDRGGAWDWSLFGMPAGPPGFVWGKVIRYRIRKPRGMVVLEQILADAGGLRERACAGADR